MNSVQETSVNRFARGCLASCQKLLTQIQRVKNAVLEEFRSSLAVNDQLLRLALNEAEALAWETDYPQLFFPALAREKAMAVAAWDTRQRRLRVSRGPFDIAA
jgi:hypothetical protein